MEKTWGVVGTLPDGRRFCIPFTDGHIVSTSGWKTIRRFAPDAIWAEADWPDDAPEFEMDIFTAILLEPANV